MLVRYTLIGVIIIIIIIIIFIVIIIIYLHYYRTPCARSEMLKINTSKKTRKTKNK